MKKLFGGINMKWLYVLLFALGAGVYTGLVLCIPALNETSFQDIGISYEWWVIFAVIVVVNCDKSWEAALKCFLFFLISQPVVYLVEILCRHLTFDQAWIYYRQMWLPMTFATLPGGFIAYFCKKPNAFGSVVMALGNTIEGVMAASLIAQSVDDFPHHIISAAVCVAAIVVMTLCVQKNKTYRIVTFVLSAVFIAAILMFMKVRGMALY